MERSLNSLPAINVTKVSRTQPMKTKRWTTIIKA